MDALLLGLLLIILLILLVAGFAIYRMMQDEETPAKQPEFEKRQVESRDEPSEFARPPQALVPVALRGEEEIQPIVVRVTFFGIALRWLQMKRQIRGRLPLRVAVRTVGQEAVHHLLPAPAPTYEEEEDEEERPVIQKAEKPQQEKPASLPLIQVRLGGKAIPRMEQVPLAGETIDLPRLAQQDFTLYRQVLRCLWLKYAQGAVEEGATSRQKCTFSSQASLEEKRAKFTRKEFDYLINIPKGLFWQAGMLETDGMPKPEQGFAELDAWLLAHQQALITGVSSPSSEGEEKELPPEQEPEYHPVAPAE